jgi:hypothetical protein
MKRVYEIVFITALFFAICFIYKGQQRITLNNGQGWDGAYYFKITEQIQQGTNPIVGELPFIKRIGTHFLVGTYSRITGIDILDSALFINLIGTFITVLLLMFWLRLYIDVFWIRGSLLLLFMMAWFVPLRFLFFYPLSTDAWGSAWFVGGLLLLHFIRESYNDNKNIFWYVLAFSVIVSVGSLFRESNSVLAIALFFIVNPLKYLNISSKTITLSHGVKTLKQIWNLYFVKQSLIFFLPLLFIGLINIIVSNFIAINQSDYSYFKTVFSWFYTKSLPEYLLGICIAYGPLLLLVPFFHKQFVSLFFEKQELLFLLIIGLIFGFIGGSDTERITFMSSFPIIFVLIGLSVKSIFYSNQRWWLYALFLLQTIAYRFFWTIPDFPSEIRHIPIPFLSLMSNHFQNLLLYSHHGHFLLNTILLIEYLLLFLVTFYVLHNKVVMKSFKILEKYKLSNKS